MKVKSLKPFILSFAFLTVIAPGLASAWETVEKSSSDGFNPVQCTYRLKFTEQAREGRPERVHYLYQRSSGTTSSGNTLQFPFEPIVANDWGTGDNYTPPFINFTGMGGFYYDQKMRDELVIPGSARFVIQETGAPNDAGDHFSIQFVFEAWHSNRRSSYDGRRTDGSSINGTSVTSSDVSLEKDCGYSEQIAELWSTLDDMARFFYTRFVSNDHRVAALERRIAALERRSRR